VSYSIEISDTAKAETRQIYEYLAGYDPHIADKHLVRLTNSISLVGRDPFLCGFPLEWAGRPRPGFRGRAADARTATASNARPGKTPMISMFLRSNFIAGAAPPAIIAIDPIANSAPFGWVVPSTPPPASPKLRSSGGASTFARPRNSAR